MIEEKKAVTAELRNIERMMVDVEKRLTYLLTEFAVEEDEPNPAMGDGMFTTLGHFLIQVHESHVTNRELMVSLQNTVHTQWGR